jgi:thiosulfate dehydrogenase
MRSIVAAFAVSLAFIVSPLAIAAETDAGNVAHGGRLYDKWYKEAKVAEPQGNHVAWPASNERTGADTFRCKSCHGWDLLGKDGAYSKGSWLTGIVGISGAAGDDPAAIVEVLKDANHGFGGVIADGDLMALATFVSLGQIDMTPYIDSATKAAKGDAAEGARVYESVCTGCHGADGKGVPNSPALGGLALDNPWEIMHKISFGQPAEAMPAMWVFGPKVAGDLLAYLQTLPAE